MPPTKYQGNAHIALVAQDNIDMFVKAAVEYGLPESAAFPSLDLYEAHKGTFYNVILSLNKLGLEVRVDPVRNIQNFYYVVFSVILPIK